MSEFSQTVPELVAWARKNDFSVSLPTERLAFLLAVATLNGERMDGDRAQYGAESQDEQVARADQGGNEPGGHDHDYEIIKRPNCYIIKSGTDFREFSKISLKINNEYLEKKRKLQSQLNQQLDATTSHRLLDELGRDVSEPAIPFFSLKPEDVVEPARRKRAAAKPARADRPRNAPG